MHDTARHGVAVGFFDGVHLGHREILSRARCAITFRNHPLEIVAPDRAPRLVMTFDERIEAIRSCGVEDVTALDFTAELAQMAPEDFARAFIVERRVVCGDNWRFGRGGAGNAALLRSLGYEVEMCPAAILDGERISSTRIRKTIESGRLEDAARMLGRPWRISGDVAPGKGEGRKLGFPTINIGVDHVALRPPAGVYAVLANGVPGVANYGFAPTFGERAWTKPVLEVHLLEGDGANIPPSDVHVDVISFIRPERKFATMDELRGQVAKDVASAGAIISCK